MFDEELLNPDIIDGEVILIFYIFLEKERSRYGSISRSPSSQLSH